MLELYLVKPERIHFFRIKTQSIKAFQTDVINFIGFRMFHFDFITLVKSNVTNWVNWSMKHAKNYANYPRYDLGIFC